MSDSPEVIQAQMEETRESLADKLEELGNKVSHTVEKVTDTVENTVEAVTETAEQAAEAVTETAQQAAHAVRETLDIPSHIQNHPWLWLGGSLAVGYLAGRLMPSASHTVYQKAQHTAQSVRDYLEPQARYVPTPEQHVSPEHVHAAPQKNGHSSTLGFLGGLLEPIQEAMGPEMERLKGMAIGATLSLLRDVAIDAIPDTFKEQVGEVFDNVTRRFGGEPTPTGQQETPVERYAHSKTHTEEAHS